MKRTVPIGESTLSAGSRLWIVMSLGLVVIAAALAFPKLSWTQFGDEIWVTGLLRSGSYGAHENLMPPLSFLFTRLVVAVCGYGDTCLRLPAYLFWIILAALPLALPSNIDRLVSFFWTVLLAFSSPLIFYSARLKQYALEAVISTLLLIFFIRAASDLNRRRPLHVYLGIALVAALTTHAPVFVIAATGATLAAIAVRQGRHRLAAGVLAAHAGLAIAFAGAYSGYMRPAGNVRRYLALHGQSRFFDGSFTFAYEQTRQWVGEMLNVTRGATLVALVCMAFVAWRSRRNPHIAGVLLIAVMLPLIALLLSAWRLYPYGEVRLMIFAAPALFLVIAIGLAAIARSHAILLVIALSMMGVFIFRQVAYDPYNSGYMQAFDLRSSYAYVARHHHPGVPFVTRAFDALPLTYYVPATAGDIVETVHDLPTSDEFWVFSRLPDEGETSSHSCRTLLVEGMMHLRRCSKRGQ